MLFREAWEIFFPPFGKCHKRGISHEKWTERQAVTWWELASGNSYGREHGARTSNYETPRKKSRGCTDVKYSESNHGSGMRGRKRVNALNKSSSHHTETTSVHIWCSRKCIRLSDVSWKIYWKLGYIFKTTLDGDNWILNLGLTLTAWVTLRNLLQLQIYYSQNGSHDTTYTEGPSIPSECSKCICWI